MPRSVGEAAATGLDAGLNLGMSIVNQRRQQDRQDTQDAMYAEDRQRLIQRQQMQDQGAALDAQLKDLNSEGAAMEASPTPPSADAMADYAQRVSTVKQARTAHYAKLSGVVVQDAHAGAAQDLQALDAGNLGAVKNLARAVTVGTGQNPNVFIRPQGGQAPIEQAGQDFITGIQSGDKDKMLSGANLIFGPKLQQGVGQPSPHGGTIVGKEIANIVPDPTAPKDDPRYIPVLKVYVKQDNFNGPGDPDHGGATGSYTAPLTEGRATGPDAKVKSLSTKDVMDFVGHNLHVVELLNQPDALAKMQSDQQAAPFDPNEYLTALQQAGVQPNKVQIKETVIPAGGTLSRTTTDARTGRVIKQESIQGNAKINPADKLTIFSQGIDKQVQDGVMTEEQGAKYKDDFAKRQASGSADATMNDKIDQINNDDSLSDAEKATQIKAVRSGIKPAAPGSQRGSNVDDKRIGRQIQVLKDQRLELDNKRKNALEEFKLASHEASRKDAAAAKVIYDAKVKALESDDSDLKGRIKKLNDTLDAADEPLSSAARPGKGVAGDLGADGDTSPAAQAKRDADAGNVILKEDGGPATAPARLQKMRTEAATSMSTEAKKVINANADLLENAMKSSGSLASAAKPGAKLAQLPTTKAALTAGTIYQTRRGPAKWNGTAFEAQP